MNVVVSGKHPTPQWLTIDAATKHCAAGIGIRDWAGNEGADAPDVEMACCGDVPTLGTLAVVSILRTHLSHLKNRVMNVMNLMKFQPHTEHPHGFTDMAFDEIFTKDKPIIFAFQGYPRFIYQLTYRRTNYYNLQVRGYEVEGFITAPSDMTVLNEIDRFQRVIDVIDRLPVTSNKGLYLKRQPEERLIERRSYSFKQGENKPEICNWKWGDLK